MPFYEKINRTVRYIHIGSILMQKIYQIGRIYYLIN